MPSDALQSPFSWTWKPCPPGVRPDSLAFTTTLSPFCVNVTVPEAVLPAVGASVVVAVCAAAAAEHVAKIAQSSGAAVECLIDGLLVECGVMNSAVRTVSRGHDKRRLASCQTHRRAGPRWVWGDAGGDTRIR